MAAHPVDRRHGVGHHRVVAGAAPRGQLVEHRGLDFVLPYLETDLSHDFTGRAQGDLSVLYQYAYQLFVLDLTQNPPRDIGPDKKAFLTGLAGYTYNFTRSSRPWCRAGGVLASAPPRDTDQRAVLAPSAAAEVYYSRDFFNLVGAASYT